MKASKIIVISLLSLSTIAYAKSAWTDNYTGPRKGCQSKNCHYIRQHKFFVSKNYYVESNNLKLISDQQCRQQTDKTVIFDYSKNAFMTATGKSLGKLGLTYPQLHEKLNKYMFMDMRKLVLSYTIDGKKVSAPTYSFTVVDTNKNQAKGLWVNDYCRGKEITVLSNKI